MSAIGPDIVGLTVECNRLTTNESIRSDKEMVRIMENNRRKKENDVRAAVVEKASHNRTKGKLKNAEDIAVSLLLDRDSLIDTIKFLQGKWAPGKKDEFMADARSSGDQQLNKDLKDQLKVDEAYEKIEKVIDNKSYTPRQIPRSSSSKRASKFK